MDPRTPGAAQSSRLRGLATAGRRQDGATIPPAQARLRATLAWARCLLPPPIDTHCRKSSRRRPQLTCEGAEMLLSRRRRASFLTPGGSPVIASRVRHMSPTDGDLRTERDPSFRAGRPVAHYESTRMLRGTRGCRAASRTAQRLVRDSLVRKLEPRDAPRRRRRQPLLAGEPCWSPQDYRRAPSRRPRLVLHVAPRRRRRLRGHATRRGGTFRALQLRPPLTRAPGRATSTRPRDRSKTPRRICRRPNRPAGSARSSTTASPPPGVGALVGTVERSTPIAHAVDADRGSPKRWRPPHSRSPSRTRLKARNQLALPLPD